MNKVRIWDVSSGRELISLDAGAQSLGSSNPDLNTGRKRYFGWKNTFAFSHDNRQCAVAVGNVIKLFDPATGRNLATIGGHSDEVTAVNFSPDGKSLATTSLDGTIKIWDVSAAAIAGRVKLARTLSGMAIPVESAAFSGDGRGLAVSGSSAVRLWELNTGAALRTITRPARARGLDDVDNPAPGVFSAGGQFIAAQSGTNEIKLWETRTGREVKSFPISQGNKFAGGGVSPDGKWVALAEHSPDTFSNLSQGFLQSLPSPTGDSKKDEKARKKSLKERLKEAQDLEKQMKKDEERFKDLADRGDFGKIMDMSADAAAFYSGFNVNVKLWDVNAASGPRSLSAKPSQQLRDSVFAFNNDGSLLAWATGKSSFVINETASGRELHTISLPRSILGVSSLAWSADGRMLASSSLDGNSINLWDAATGRELRSMSAGVADIRVMSFSPDSRMLALAGDNASVHLLDTTTGQEIMTLNGHRLRVNTLAFSNDGKLLVSGSDDGSARLWDVQSGETLATLITFNSGADWLVVMPDGLFDGTPGAWSQILWRFSPDNIFDVAPVEIFFNDFFYPGLLADIASGKRPKAAQDVAKKDRRQPILNLSRVDGQKTGRTVKVKLEISEPASAGQASPVGASDVRLFRNGTLVKVWRGDALKGHKQATLEAEIPIVAGENRILAYAFNRDGVKSSDAVLTVTGDESLRRNGVAYVIACGVNQYANPEYNLKYAVADATSFGEEVSAQQLKLGEYERVEVITLLDKDATKTNILLALKRLSSDQSALPAGAPASLSKIQTAQPEDAVFIFFAGHGVAQGARFYLIPHDIGYAGKRDALTAEAVKTILSHGVSDLELEAAIEGVEAGRLLFVVDTCNSGQALEAEEKRRGPMNSSGLAQLAYEKGMYILTAAQSYQAALEASQLGHGYLTFALIEDGLKKGLSDRDPKDGQALAREWFNYAEERVPQMQEREMQTRLLLNFAMNEAKDPKQRDIQRPRVFYRRELEAHPFVVAKP
jgi:WD40 repeat protein